MFELLPLRSTPVNVDDDDAKMWGAWPGPARLTCKHCVCRHEVEEADQIYLLMKEEYRISRNVRLAWFLGKLNQVIWPASKTELVRKKRSLFVTMIIKPVLLQIMVFDTSGIHIHIQILSFVFMSS